MSATHSLTNFYDSFFMDSAKFALSPYRLTMRAWMRNPDNPKLIELALGVITCVVLSTVIPILPTVTSFTMAIAFIGIAFALASALIAYPIAWMVDAFDSSPSSSTTSPKNA
jgi:hypothetical protein